LARSERNTFHRAAGLAAAAADEWAGGGGVKWRKDLTGFQNL